MKSWLDNDLVQKFDEWGRVQLRSNIMERDESPSFNLQIWENAQKMGLVEALKGENFQNEMKVLTSIFYGLAKGSLDLPFCSSLAAHSAIAMDLMNHFSTPEQKKKYGDLIKRTDSIMAICNSEEGAGSDLKKMKALALADENGQAVVHLMKPCATNASHAELFLVSVWIEKPQQKRKLGVILLEKAEVESWSLQNDLSGFRTGLTGGLRVANLKITLKERLLNTNVGSFNIFKRCFDMERLFLGVMVAGIFEGIEEEIKKLIVDKESQGFSYKDKQYLQEKLINVYKVRTQISSIVEKILISGQEFNFNDFSKELCLLKIWINEDAVQALSNYYELLGHRGYLKNQICQKLLRDFMGLRYFGGTIELQKITLFQELTVNTTQYSASKVA